MRYVGVHRAFDQRDGGPLDEEVLTPDLLLEDGEGLGEGVTRQMSGRVAPEEIHQVVTRQPTPRFDGETNQQREVLTRAEPDLLPRSRQQQGGSEREQVQVRLQTDGSQCFGLVLLDA